MTQNITVPGAEYFTEAAERAQGTFKQAGNLAVDQYEKGVATYLDFQGKAAEAAPAEIVKTAIEQHAALVKDVTDAYVKAARTVLA